jgi:hypothetical protein
LSAALALAALLPRAAHLPGIGKTTISTWICRLDDVRKNFGYICWIALGQSPVCPRRPGAVKRH